MTVSRSFVEIDNVMAGTAVFTVFVLLTFGLCSGYSPVYGFDGVATTLTSGKTLHYYVRLNKCRQTSGIGDQEFAQPLGSHVTKWRSFNEAAKKPYVVFHEQIPVFNRIGNLVQLSRDVKVVSNNSVSVTSSVFSPDYGSLLNMFNHECTMSSPEMLGDVEFRASDEEPTRLNTVDNIVAALEAGDYLHFNAMTFLCPGGQEHSFSGLGGYIPNYELVYGESGEVSEIRVFVQTTVHYNTADNAIFAAVIDFTIRRNNTVTIVDTLASTPNYIRTAYRISNCPLETGPPGGMFSVYV